MGRPKTYTKETGEALLDAAERLLAEGGPEAVSVRAVAEAGGTTTRAVYSIFGSMAGLIEGLAARGFRILTEYTTQVPPTDDPLDDLVTIGIEAFGRFALERPHLYRLTFERPPAGIVSVPTVGSAAMASYEVLSGWVRRAQAAGAIRDDLPVVEIVFAYHALNHGMASSILLREPPPIGSGFWIPAWGIDATKLWRTALEALLGGMTPAAAGRAQAQRADTSTRSGTSGPSTTSHAGRARRRRA